MERKDYAEKFMAIKNDILKEIREILPSGETHKFKETFFVHYVCGEVATTENCTEVRNDYGCIGFKVNPVDSAVSETNGYVDGEDIFNFEPNTFIDVFENLHKELREEKLSRLRNLVKKAGGKMNFDGSFGFHSIVDGDHVSGEKSFITCIELDNTFENRVYLDCNFSEEKVEEQEENIPLDELDRIIAYVDSKTKKKFSIKVSGSFSRTFEIEASSYEEALAEAKKDWEINPLYFGDSNGEDWEDYTSIAH